MKKMISLLALPALLWPFAMTQPALAISEDAVTRACGLHSETPACHRACAAADKARYPGQFSLATIHTCAYVLRSAESRELSAGDTHCNAKSCIYKLMGGHGAFQGGGYRVRYVPTASGRDIRITDPKGRLSLYDQCGTCGSQDYASGPLKKVEINAAGPNAIMLQVYK